MNIIILIIIISSTLIFVSIKKYGIMNPITINCILWDIMLLLLFIYREKYFSMDNNTFIASLLYFIVFPIGSILGRKYKFIIKKDKNVYDATRNNRLRYTVFLTLVTISVIYLTIKDFIIIKELIARRTFYDLARDGITTNEFYHGSNAYIMIFIVFPTVYMASPICAIEFFSNRYKRKKYLVINIILVVLSALDHGARVQLVNMIVCYALAFFCYKEKYSKIDIKKYKKRIIILIILLFSFIFILSKSRGIEDLYDSYIFYVTCSIPHMVTRLNQEIFKNRTMYGFLSFRGLIGPLVLLLQYFLGIGFNKNYILSENMVSEIEKGVLVGPNLRTNAFLPLYFYFYIDFGFFGVIIGTLIYSYFLSNLYEISKEKNNLKLLSLYLLLMCGLVSGFIRFPFASYQYALAFVYILFFMYRKNYRRDENKDV